jgi:hypothetical protein
MHLDIEFIKTFGLDEETTKELIATYVEQMEAYQKQLQEVDMTDSEVIRTIAHSIKGASLIMGDVIIPDICDKISRNSNEDTVELSESYVISLQRLLPDAIAETKKHLLYDSRNL